LRDFKERLKKISELLSTSFKPFIDKIEVSEAKANFMAYRMELIMATSGARVLRESLKCGIYT